MNIARCALVAIAVAASAAAGAQTTTPSPALLVLNKEEGALVIVDPRTMKIAGRVPTGQGPHELAVSADGRTAFVGNYGTGPAPGSTISVIDLVAQKELRRVDVSPLRRPHGIAFAGGRVFFTAEADKMIAQYDPATNEVTPVFRTGQEGTHMVLVSKDLRKIFTANIGSNSITVLERPAGETSWASAKWNETVIPVGRGPEGIDLSPDGKELWTAHSRDGGVSIIDVASKKVTATLDLQTRRSNRLKFTSDGKRVLVSDLEGGVLIVVDAPARKEITDRKSVV